MGDLPAWLARLEPDAPDLVAPFRAIAADRPLSVRREVGRRAGEGSVARILPQHAAIADAFEAHLRSLPDAAFAMPSPADAGREALLRRLATSRRLIERASRSIAGRELAPCPLEHPLVGRLRCGEWFVFAGVHDLMHLEQLIALEARLAARDDDRPSAAQVVASAAAVVTSSTALRESAPPAPGAARAGAGAPGFTAPHRPNAPGPAAPGIAR